MARASSTAAKPRKYFTVEEANRALPLVRRILDDIVRQYRVVEELHERLATVLGRRRGPSEDAYSEEVDQSQTELESEMARLTSYIEEMRGLGIEFKGPEGLCDFYSMMDGREVFLCWRLGEPEVSHWHELDAGFAGRRPLPAHTASARGPA